MELVYLWVEEYKNIHHQGFNFSPRFRCEFKAEYEKDENGKEKLKDNCELIICDKEDSECKNKEECKDFCSEPHIKDFFGDNINVTAIVGKNGSGKSSVFEILSQILFVKNNSKYFYILYDGNEQYCYSNNIDVKTSINIEKYESLDRPPFSSSHNTNISIGRYLQMWYLNISHLERDGIIKKDAVETHEEINYLGIYEKNNLTDTLNDSILQSFSNFNLRNFNFLLTEKIVNLLKYELYKTYIFKHLKIIEPFHLKLLYNETELKQQLEALRNDTHLDCDDSIEELEELLKIHDDNILEIEDEDYKTFFKLVNKIYSSTEIPFNLIFLDKRKKQILLSGGEKTIIFYIERIAYLLQQIEQMDTPKPIILLIDELELYLHPSWQRKLLEIILGIVKKSDAYKKFHLILSTHSPFLLSDIPKQNIIFLDTYKKEEEEVKGDRQKVGNCRVLPHDEVFAKKETFGANIHTLLSDSFFMEDGLMGEFAKGKIEEVIDFLRSDIPEVDSIEANNNNPVLTIEKVESIIAVVGEPLLQARLQKMLVDYKKRHDLYTESDIERQIEELQAHLAEMRRDG